MQLSAVSSCNTAGHGFRVCKRSTTQFLVLWELWRCPPDAPCTGWRGHNHSHTHHESLLGTWMQTGSVLSTYHVAW
jgi:hypothetical protein